MIPISLENGIWAIAMNVLDLITVDSIHRMEFSDLVVIIRHISQHYPIHTTTGQQLEDISRRSIEVMMPTLPMILSLSKQEA